MRKAVILIMLLLLSLPSGASRDTLTLHFPMNSVQLTAAAKDSIDTRLYYEFFDRGSFIIYGFADAVGDTAYNRRLSESRAEAVKDHLTRTMGLRLDVSVCIGRGEDFARQYGFGKAGIASDRVVKIIRVRSPRPAPVASRDTSQSTGTANVYTPKWIGPIRGNAPPSFVLGTQEMNRRHYLAWSGRTDTLQDTITQLAFGPISIDPRNKKALLMTWSGGVVGGPVRGTIGMDLAMIYAVEKKADSVFHWMHAALDACPPDAASCDDVWNPNILGFYHFAGLRGMTEWKRIEARILDRFNARKAVPDKALALQLLLAGGADQSVRLRMPLRDTALPRWQKEIHRQNLSLIRSIVAKKGYPRKSRVGEDAAEAAFLLVQHSEDTTLQKKAMDQVAVLVRTGEAEKESLALLTDRYLVNTKGYQLYGTQFRTDSGDIFPVLDMEKVDERRAAMGMEPLVRKDVVERR